MIFLSPQVVDETKFERNWVLWSIITWAKLRKKRTSKRGLLQRLADIFTQKTKFFPFLNYLILNL